MKENEEGMPKFIVREGSRQGVVIPMENKQLVFGRTEECDVMLADPNVSRRHAQAVLLNGLVAMVDLNSSNGTLVNGVPISRIFLMDGDEVRLGSTMLVFADDSEDGRSDDPLVPSRDIASPTPRAAFSQDSLGSDSADPLSHTQMFDPVSADEKSDVVKEVYVKLKSLYRVFHEVAQAGSLKEMFEAVGRAITLSTGVQRVVYFLNAEKSGGTLQRYFAHTSINLGDQHAAAAEFAPLIERAKNDRRAVLARLEEDGSCLFGSPEPNVLALPLIRGGKVAAIMYVDNPDGLRPISKNDVDFVTTLALQLSIRLNQFEQVHQLSQENQQLRRTLAEDMAVVVQNEKMKQIMEVAARVADSDSTVLVTGESGTGKELIAKTIHRFSRRGSKPLVAVNCAALTETLLESELFGHEKGAFTGAIEKRIGKFELADGGTLFLDEIGDISAAAQAKLLRVLQEGELQRVGGNKTIKVDVRLIAATNKNLLDEVKAGTFRQDLYYRLRVIEIVLPPLRDRPDDIPALAEFFFKQLKQKINTHVKSIAPETIATLARYPFPGNVRELRNVIERGLVFAFGEKLLPEHLPMEILQSQGSGMMAAVDGQAAAVPGAGAAAIPSGESTPFPLSEVEKRHIRFVLNFVKGNKLKAAGLLGISRTTLYEKLKQYDIGGADTDGEK
jgi:Nif-specific regulatory protein